MDLSSLFPVWICGAALPGDLATNATYHLRNQRRVGGDRGHCISAWPWSRQPRRGRLVQGAELLPANLVLRCGTLHRLLRFGLAWAVSLGRGVHLGIVDLGYLGDRRVVSALSYSVHGRYLAVAHRTRGGDQRQRRSIRWFALFHQHLRFCTCVHLRSDLSAPGDGAAKDYLACGFAQLGLRGGKRVLPLPQRSATVRLLLGIFLSAACGFISLSYELLWFRVYFIAKGSLASCFAVLLGAYLLALAFGALWAHRFCKKDQRDFPQYLRSIAEALVAAYSIAFISI